MLTRSDTVLCSQTKGKQDNLHVLSVCLFSNEMYWEKKTINTTSHFQLKQRRILEAFNDY